MLDQLKEQYEKIKEQPLLAWALLIIIPLILLKMCNSAQPTQTTPLAQNTTSEPNGISDETKGAITAYFKGDSEPTIKDAVWADQLENTLYIGVIDNGTKRDGLAGYVCQVLISDFGLSQGAARVYIMDVVKIAKDNKWDELGKSSC